MGVKQIRSKNSAIIFETVPRPVGIARIVNLGESELCKNILVINTLIIVYKKYLVQNDHLQQKSTRL